jgi:hypothetical protein
MEIAITEQNKLISLQFLMGGNSQKLVRIIGKGWKPYYLIKLIKNCSNPEPLLCY